VTPPAVRTARLSLSPIDPPALRAAVGRLQLKWDRLFSAPVVSFVQQWRTLERERPAVGTRFAVLLAPKEKR
jgi:hypothetical protein